jgi:uncharacterized protein (TIGR02246 family)
MTNSTTAGELQGFVEQYEAAWNSHRAEDLSGLFTDNADMIAGPEPTVAGRSEILAWWRAYFRNVKPGTRMALTIESARLLQPGVAVMNVVASRDDVARATPRARGTWVVVNDGQAWKVAASRFLPPVGGMSGPAMRENVTY